MKKIDTDRPLNEKDTEYKTFGCRCFKPDICKFCMSDKCAFRRTDKMCLEPPKSWKARYKELLKNKK